MYINEYGCSDNPRIILLAPMMVSGSDIYELMSPYLIGEYCIIAPDQGAHGKAGKYLSAEAEYSQLKDYLIEKNYKDIKLCFGASLGVALGWRLFNDDEFKVDYAWFDGVALKKSSPIAEIFMKKLFRAKKKKLKSSGADVSESLIKMYGYDFAKMMTKNFERIDTQDIDAICHACCHYDLKVMSLEKQSKLHLEYGENDMDLSLSKKAFSKYIPEVNVVIRKGYSHCGYMAAHPKEYVEEIEKFFNS
ncbi:MAG: hypothetical protein K6A23_01220 [Butyrivibrio sp.]|nr:hypothetical protein [Butyrivibrio sp.]